jgi:hypothetical protein
MPSISLANSTTVVLLAVNPLLPFGASSARSAARAVRDGIHLLIDGFILKPFNSEDLKAKLVEVADRRSGKSAAAN